jgi:SAM-dependent methyltransferase
MTFERQTNMPTNYFGESVAKGYDADLPEWFDAGVVGPVVDALAEMALNGNALELGIGTGRIALPLSQRGIRVHGIDLSPEMLNEMRRKPGAEAIDVTTGDFATTKVGKTFDLAYIVFNTITNLTTQEAQVACFRNVATHLKPGGCFVIEVFVPELRRLPPGAKLIANRVGAEKLDFDEYDVATQGLISHHYRSVDGKLTGYSSPFRYVWPAELDLMAQLAGMTLRDRWEYWDRRPFTNESPMHVSVWELP